MKIHIVMHEEFEGPGAFKHWIESHDYHTSYTKLYLNESLPKDTDFLDMLIIFGGPQSPKTTQLECSYFDSKAEINLIQTCIQKGKAVIGVCLGAQLIGEALGATFETSPEQEIGFFPVSLTETGKTNKKFTHFQNSTVIGHWHNDMPGLTENCKILATSEGCPRQIIEYTDIVYGFQCHLEFTPDLIELLIKNSSKELESAKNARFVQQADELRDHNYYIEMNKLLFSFLDKLVYSYQKS